MFLTQETRKCDKRLQQTGTMYLHIGQQTDEKPIMHEQVEKFSRETQLCSLRNQSWNTKREAFTQMDRRDLVLDSTFDHSCIPGRYVGSKEWEEKRNTACINIQRYVRRWIAICQYKRLQNYAQEMHVFFVEQEKIELAEAEECIRREMNRRKHPRALSDFLILYEELASWHVEAFHTRRGCQIQIPNF
ncbi:hypothetical protein O6H91_01G023300 [Diphasiastrum complanatum]|uniref:Uncharacterized protein n=1 Tax=Diphasiastrum complanatum TaxID=34168 RepID=A0ACC2EP00_DIPCM|nr:hypothetical protein O6H91_01G023300 [Diphasiastrum complanatum]